jgi:hypothetical protein
VEDLEERYHTDKKRMKEIIEDLGLKVTRETTPGELLAAISTSSKFSSISPNNVNRIVMRVCKLAAL